MTDEFKEVISGIRERITNPLVSAFVLSWLVANWKFCYVLVFADTSDVLIFSGQTSKYGYAQSLITKETSLCYPLTFAIFYVLLMPFAKGGIHLVTVWVKKIVTIRVEKNRIGDFVAFKKHLDLFNKYNKLKQNVTEYSKQEAELLEVKFNLEGEVNALQSQNENLAVDLSNQNTLLQDWSRLYKNMVSVNVLNGEYTSVRKGEGQNSDLKEYLVFKDGVVSRKVEIGPELTLFRLTNFTFNCKLGTVSFVFFPINGISEGTKVDFFDLTVRADGVLSGNVIGSSRVDFTPLVRPFKYLDEINYFKREEPKSI